MKPHIALAVVVFAPLSASAEARKPCQELKAEITKKIEANKVSAYWLEIVETDKHKDGAVVGSCDGGTKVVVYHHGEPPKQSDPKDAEAKVPNHHSELPSK
jgi:Protein of unknown function (DUF1161)